MKGPFLPRRISVNGHEWIWVNSNALNREKYDYTIESLGYWPFMFSWYWDAVSYSWGAFVKGDYEEVLPICYRWKFGILPMLVTPYCVKWIEGDASVAEQIISRTVGFKNLAFAIEVAGCKSAVVQVLTIDNLWTPSGDLKRNVKKSVNKGYQFKEKGNWSNFSQLMRDFHPYTWTGDDEAAMESLYLKSSDLGYGFISEVWLENEVVASYFFILYKSKVLLVQNVTHSQHKGGSPMALLIYSIIEKLRVEKIFPEIHFMGSTNPGAAEFNKKFGAIDRKYFRLKNY